MIELSRTVHPGQGRDGAASAVLLARSRRSAGFHPRCHRRAIVPIGPQKPRISRPPLLGAIAPSSSATPSKRRGREEAAGISRSIRGAMQLRQDVGAG